MKARDFGAVPNSNCPGIERKARVEPRCRQLPATSDGGGVVNWVRGGNQGEAGVAQFVQRPTGRARSGGRDHGNGTVAANVL